VIHDATSVSSGSTLDTDVCLVGGGAAGITLALELERAGLEVLLLESGGVHFDETTQDLYRGEPAAGQLARRTDYLQTSRLRFLGGATNHWGGYCSPLDAIDFERRDWFAHSGWPFERAALEPFYRRAAGVLQIRPFDYGLGQLSRSPLDLGGDSGIETHVYHLSPPTRFGSAYRGELAASPRTRLLLNANALEILANDTATRVEGVRVRTLAGSDFHVRARRVVLAAGAIENARLLLASAGVQSAGLGNGRDLVGRYFMDHLYGARGIGHALFIEPGGSLSLYAAETRDDFVPNRHFGVLSLSAALQQQHALPNHQLRLLPVAPRSDLAALPRSLASVTSDLGRAAGYPPRPGVAERLAALEIGLEPRPDPENRVTLAAERDALGMPRLRIRYEIGAWDEEALERMLRVFAERLGRTLRARVRLAGALPRIGGLDPGSHHIGTTRMHVDPSQGVVDADCRVHGLANLYVAGSSVFPTAGRANPTYTLVALAIRLADHLAGGTA
jgi:choline dehydrogenase-like flavoprotein